KPDDKSEALKALAFWAALALLAMGVAQAWGWRAVGWAVIVWTIGCLVALLVLVAIGCYFLGWRTRRW
ncbi:MAG TPA: hypothetical protein VFZ16_08110, partial [Hyphomicrobiaceae bacterium]|nr:hypothetical protein [Hyphomicrobiaceae bacterium]